MHAWQCLQKIRSGLIPVDVVATDRPHRDERLFRPSLEVLRMLTFDDCLALCELTEEEVDAIAEHEHLPEILALELGSYLVKGSDGQLLIQHMIFDDIQAAHRRGDVLHAARLKRTLRQFIEEQHAKAPPR
jgi:hypothetical protein